MNWRSVIMGHKLACTQNRWSGSLLSEYDVIVLMEYKLEDVKVKKPRLQVLFCWRHVCIMGRLARIPREYKLERTEVKSSDSMVLAQWKEKIISIHQYTQCERAEVKSSDLALHLYPGWFDGLLLLFITGSKKSCSILVIILLMPGFHCHQWCGHPTLECEVNKHDQCLILVLLEGLTTN